MFMLLKNQSMGSGMVAITGAAGGLGGAFAVECASRGWNLFLIDQNAGKLKILSEGLQTCYGVKVLSHVCDLTDSDARTALYKHINDESLTFWSLINIAGIDYEGPFLEQTSRHIRTIIRLNIEATLDITHALLNRREMLSTFRIINVASLAAFYPMPLKATYAASKRFLLDFSLALREEVRDMGATVTVLCPAGLPTTPECIQAIEAQGWMGYITTMDTGRVANETLNAALKGRALVIPGWVNRTLQIMGSLVPHRIVAGIIARRWKTARQKRTLLQQPAS
jgi:short-subunit dehydrogenase